MAVASGKEPWWARDYAPGLLLALAALVSFVWQNSALRDAFDTLFHSKFTLGFTGASLETDFLHVIDDGLMAIFFLFVGLELKRECVEGPFRNVREAALPLFGALGGMVAPALIYAAIAIPADPAYARGWAIPTATDIAFALGVLSLLGSRVPAGLRLFLLALAIVDDLGAILVIAFFYTDHVAGWALGGATVTFLAMLGLNRGGVKRLSFYWPLAFILWGFVLASGVHATIAGVLAAMAIPMRRPDGRSPLVEAEHALRFPVQLGIMPLFALGNAGAPLDTGFGALAHPVAIAVMAGLTLGKPLGVTVATLAASAIFKRPPPCGLRNMIGLGLLAGIGFTMSLFIGGLAFGQGPEAAPLRLGVLAGSIMSAVLGVLLIATGKTDARHDPKLASDEDVAEAKGVLDKQ